MRNEPSTKFNGGMPDIIESPSFVAGQLLFVAGWILVNASHVFAVRHFVPVPLSLLSSGLALEGILLASFIS
jgi:uncharacterized membrane protein